MGEAVDLIIRNARLIDEDKLMDIAIKDDKIVRVDKKVKAVSKAELDVGGKLTSPGFVDAHMHLDHPFTGGDLIWTCRRLPKAVEITDKITSEMTSNEIRRIARMTAEMALMNGTTALRTHATINQITGVKLAKVLLDLKKEFSNWIDIQVVAFVTEIPLTDSKVGESLLRQAMSLGAEVVGGLSYRDPNPEKYLDIMFKVAKDFKADIDLHVDETNNPNILTLETLAEKTLKYGYQGRVTASHCCSLSAVSDDTAKRVIRKVRSAKMNVIANPLTNLYLKGEDGKPNGLTRVKELLDAGVNVIFATDNTRDSFNPMGTSDMLQAALFLSYLEDFGKNPAKILFEMGTSKAADVIKTIPNYGIKEGGKADLVVFDAKNPDEALIKQARRLHVIKNGKMVVEDGVLRLR